LKSYVPFFIFFTAANKIKSSNLSFAKNQHHGKTSKLVQSS